MNIIKVENPIEHIHEINEFIQLWSDSNQSITQQTSGSTGTAKVIEIPKWKMRASAEMTGRFLGLDQCKSSLICMSTKYIGGKMMLVRSILYDLTLYVTNVTRNPLKNINFPIDFAAMVPLQVETILSENPEKLNLIKHLIIGGAPVSDHLIEQLKNYTCQAYSTFGMTETVSHIALRSLKVTNEPYFALGNTHFSTHEDCLVISCEELGIKNLITTDVVELIDNKRFRWLGRADFVINSGGVKIHPEQLEKKISKAIQSERFIISKLPDPQFGEKVIFIGEKDLDTQELKFIIEANVDRYERPKEFYFISSLHKTASGKVDRNKTTQAIS